MVNENGIQNNEGRINKFFQKLRLDINLIETELSNSPLPQQEERQTSSTSSEDKLYGVVSREEFQNILSSYENQQNSSDLKNKPVTCDKVSGKCFAKLLYSKPGFHHPGSTDHLVQDLKINDVHRNTFLGGVSNYIVNEDGNLTGLWQKRRNLILKVNVDNAAKFLAEGKPAEARKLIDLTLKDDPNNGYALAVRAQYYRENLKFDLAIEDLTKVLQEDSFKDKKKIYEGLGVSTYEIGLRSYHRNDFQAAINKFDEVLRYAKECEAADLKKEVEGAKLHKEICKTKLSQYNRSRFSFQKPQPQYRG